jgi:quercetin dioxygenase-like cupin family protein
MRSTLTRFGPLLGLVAVSGAFAAAAIATPPVGQHPSVPVLGTFAGRQHVDTDGIKFKTRGPADVASFTVTYDPGGYSGWHTHPGMIIAVVQTGAVVREVGCRSRIYKAGEAFIESDEQPSGQVRNASATDPAVVVATQIVPQGSPRRVDQDAAPTCHH